MNESRTEIQKSDGVSAAAVPELTRSGPVFAPSVDIFETESAITVLADMPGAEPENLKIDLRENVLTLIASLSDPLHSKGASVVSEYKVGTFLRQFTLSEAIDQSKIDARLTDGVLRLELPKVEKAKPRQIAVRS